jgi:hypothetical protein
MNEELIEQVKVISDECGVPEGTILTLDYDQYYNMDTVSDIVDNGLEITTTTHVAFTKLYVEENLGMYFVRTNNDPVKTTFCDEDCAACDEEIDTTLELWQTFDQMVAEMNNIFNQHWENFEGVMNRLVYGK